MDSAEKLLARELFLLFVCLSINLYTTHSQNVKNPHTWCALWISGCHEVPFFLFWVPNTQLGDQQVEDLCQSLAPKLLRYRSRTTGPDGLYSSFWDIHFLTLLKIWTSETSDLKSDMLIFVFAPHSSIRVFSSKCGSSKKRGGETEFSGHQIHPTGRCRGVW